MGFADVVRGYYRMRMYRSRLICFSDVVRGYYRMCSYHFYVGWFCGCYYGVLQTDWVGEVGKGEEKVPFLASLVLSLRVLGRRL